MTREAPKAINPIDENVSWDEAYEVVIHNDTVTPLEFVVDLLMTHFTILQNDAVQIALRVHAAGKASIGRLSKESSERTKTSMMSASTSQDHPLRVDISKWSVAE